MAKAETAETTGDVGRHKSRRNAMMVLYKLDLMPGDVVDAIAAWEREHEFSMPPYARQLVEEVSASRDTLDSELQGLLDEWSLERLGAIERNILRLALWELRTGEVPVEVAIDEAVELAKRYASPEAAKLVNGVLGAWARAEGQGH